MLVPVSLVEGWFASRGELELIGPHLPPAGEVGLNKPSNGKLARGASGDAVGAAGCVDVCRRLSSGVIGCLQIGQVYSELVSSPGPSDKVLTSCDSSHFDTQSKWYE